MCFRQKMEGSQIDGCHNTQRWLKNCFAWQKNIFFNAHISQLTVRRLAFLSLLGMTAMIKDRFKKMDTFIIHMKEITDKFNLEETVPV